ncbi:MAG: choice-of-anchor L domain-containing protein, partial [Flavobacteriales bacterium]|nr:choice-of-anchor L domain-containing protein [Flavobacteriales bacterium]
MKKILFFFALVAAHSVNAQIAVTYVTADQAVQALLGPGVTYANPVFNGIAQQLGEMTGNTNPNFQITEGIVIGCSDAQDVVPNFFGTAITPNISGDPDLLSVANSVPPLIGQGFTVGSVNNIASLEFDFVAIGDSLNFNYIFGSDEYLTWVNSQY